MKKTLLGLNGASTGVAVTAMTLLGVFKPETWVHSVWIQALLMGALWLFVFGAAIAMVNITAAPVISNYISYGMWLLGMLFICQSVGYAILSDKRLDFFLITIPVIFFAFVLPFMQRKALAKRRQSSD